MLITRSKGSLSEYERRELGEARWRRRGCWRSDEKGRGDREVRGCASVQQPNPEDHVNALHFN